jgi:hypothetical protein
MMTKRLLLGALPVTMAALVLLPDPNNRTAGIKGGQTNDIKPGDVIIIPPGTAHWFSRINGHVTYIEARFPGNVLNPSAK